MLVYLQIEEEQKNQDLKNNSYMKKYIYVYQTLNLINGKTYIGVHSTNVLNDGYIGCGIKGNGSANTQIRHGRKYPFILSVVKYGYKNFKKEILSFYDNLDDAYEEESFLVDYNYVKLKTNYNVSLGGSFNKKVPKLYENKHDINKLFSEGCSYKDISKKYNSTKGAWIGLLNEESYIKRIDNKINLNSGLEFEHIDGSIHVLKDLKSFTTLTGLNSKSIYEIKNNGTSNGWYLKDSELLLTKRKLINGLSIMVNKESHLLSDIYKIGIKNFSIKNSVSESCIEKKIYNSRNKT